jgi:hypothetical protein
VPWALALCSRNWNPEAKARGAHVPARRRAKADTGREMRECLVMGEKLQRGGAGKSRAGVIIWQPFTLARSSLEN